MSAICITVLGTTGGAGKSWLATALCQYCQRKGQRVAPFKAQSLRFCPTHDISPGNVVPNLHHRNTLSTLKVINDTVRDIRTPW